MVVLVVHKLRVTRMKIPLYLTIIKLLYGNIRCIEDNYEKIYNYYTIYLSILVYGCL